MVVWMGCMGVMGGQGVGEDRERGRRLTLMGL